MHASWIDRLGAPPATDRGDHGGLSLPQWTVDRLELVRIYGYGLCMERPTPSRASPAEPLRSCLASTGG